MMIVLLMAMSSPGDSLSVMFWNLENYFDWKAEEGASDFEFSSRGPRRWTRKRFARKSDMIAKALLYVADSQGSLPDVIAFAEVENRFVLRRLIEDTPLRKLDYGIVHYDSQDPRGIDVALLFRKSRVDTLRTFPAGVPGVATRDMLVVQMKMRRTGGGRDGSRIGNDRCDAGICDEGADAATENVRGAGISPGDRVAVIVCHHPSKYGGAASVPKREAAVVRLAGLSDSLSAAGWAAQLAIGDFNDTPDSPVYQRLDAAFMNLAAEPAAKGEGSIRFDGNWELIDQCFVSRALICPQADSHTREEGIWEVRSDRDCQPITDAASPRPAASATFKVCRIPFLTVRDSAHAGEKPLRTFSGPRYLGGVSDHCPILVIIRPK